MKKLQPINNINPLDCKNIKYFFSDIDDTITINGKIPEFSFNAIWKLYNKGISVIPVTGRPAGWCDHIARMWPVKAVIGENGAFYFSYNSKTKKMKREYFIPEEQLEVNKYKLLKIKERVLKEIANSRISADQDYRITDLSIDFCEDIDHLGEEAVNRICRIAEEEGARYAVSSIHVNCWFGEFDKSACINKYLQENTSDSEDSLRKSIFIGDSPNDEPIFKIFKTSIGVANIIDFRERLKYFPGFITEYRSAYGFKEAVDVILNKRKN